MKCLPTEIRTRTLSRGNYPLISGMMQQVVHDTQEQGVPSQQRNDNAALPRWVQSYAGGSDVFLNEETRHQHASYRYCYIKDFLEGI